MRASAGKTENLALGEPYRLEMSVPQQSRRNVLRGEKNAQLELLRVGLGGNNIEGNIGVGWTWSAMIGQGLRCVPGPWCLYPDASSPELNEEVPDGTI